MNEGSLETRASDTGCPIFQARCVPALSGRALVLEQVVCGEHSLASDSTHRGGGGDE